MFRAPLIARARRRLAIVPLLAAAGVAAQTPSPAPPAAATAAAAAASAPPSGGGQRVEIVGGRESDTEQRRRSTAAKIVVGRDEIDKFGDATLGEVLRRLPGVTTPGAPGRGGAPRMRGLGSGYTQLLIDGQRIPRGFSLESLSPEQVERIEILRAPTAETGARAIAGTINIVLREGHQRRANELRLGAGLENGAVSPGVSWTRNDSAGPLTYTLSAGTFRSRRETASTTETRDVDLASGDLVGLETVRSTSQDTRDGIHLNGRLQWRLSDAGDSLLLMPTLFHSETAADRRLTATQALPPPPALPEFDSARSTTGGRTTSARLNTQWRQRLPDGSRLEVNAGAGRWRSLSSTTRVEFSDGSPTALRRLLDEATTGERSASASAKLTSLLGGSDAGGEHSLVAGVEAEAVRRTETRSTLQDRVALLPGFGDELQASSRRLAAYAQDEWSPDAHWAFHAGLRWEGIQTRGQAADGARPDNLGSVWTPLVHLLYKPDPKRKDQIRLSLTRSYRSPTLAQLIARPGINGRFPIDRQNEPTFPDSVGNPALQPELARGVDLAFERYLDGGGVLSANLFARRLDDVIRNVVTRETVSYSQQMRFVSRPRNIGGATTAGLELEAKYRLDQWLADAPRVELRHNLAVYRSRVDGVPGPDNRLDNQAPATAGAGADYRLRTVPLTLGGNVGWTPGYRTRLSDERTTTSSRKTVFDAYALWTISPQAGLRLSAANLAPRDFATSDTFATAAVRETTTTAGPTHTDWQLRLELRL